MNELEANPIESLEEVARAFGQSESKIVIIYKHSPVCGLSDMAIRQMAIFAEDLPENAALYYIDVIESRAASRKIAEITGIRHESPQVLFIQNRQCIWSASHRAIQADALKIASF